MIKLSGEHSPRELNVDEITSRRAKADQILLTFDGYITAQAYYVTQNRVGDRDLMVDEIAQIVRVQVWLALQRDNIEFLRSYIRTTVRNTFISMKRLKETRGEVPLLLNDHGEPYIDGELSEGMQDPFQVLEEDSVLDTTKIARCIQALPHRQQQAIICSLRDAQINTDSSIVFDTLDLLLKNSLNIEPTTVSWPADKDERLRLFASLTVARRKLAEMLAQEEQDEEAKDFYGRIAKRMVSNPRSRKERMNTLLARIESLPKNPSSLSEYIRERYKEPVRLYLQGRSSPEIAAQLTRNVATVRSQIYRGLRELQMALQKQWWRGTNAARIATLLGKLKEPYRTVVFLHSIEGQSYLSIANRLSIKEGTVRQYASRGLKMLDTKK